MVGEQIKNIVDARSSNLKGFSECARKGHQAMDIAFTQHLVLEKGADTHGQAAIAQADIKQYYDHLVPVLIATWLFQKTQNTALMASFLRIQLCPQISFRLLEGIITLPPRSVGLFTGCQSAVQAGRIPLLDAAEALGDLWLTNGYKFVSSDKCKRSIGISTFVDNIYSMSKQADSAVDSIEALEVFLRTHWHLQFGEDSRSVMQCQHAPDTFVPRNGWQQVECMKTLGHHVSHSGSVHDCVNSTIKQM